MSARRFGALPWLALLLVLVGFVLFGIERLFPGSGTPVTVEVLTVEGVQDGKWRTSYRHAARLPDGTVSTFWASRMHPVGERVTVVAVRGRLTRRLWLLEPIG